MSIQTLLWFDALPFSCPPCKAEMVVTFAGAEPVAEGIFAPFSQSNVYTSYHTPKLVLVAFRDNP